MFQIILPVSLCESVLKVAHDEVGHSRVKKAYARLLRHFFPPGMKNYISMFIKTCHACHLTDKPNWTLKLAPLWPILVVNKPFEHLIIDCVGPLPNSKSGLSYLPLCARVSRHMPFAHDYCLGCSAYSREHWSPLSVLVHYWREAQPLKNLIEYINGSHHRLYMAGELAKVKAKLSKKEISVWSSYR